MNVFISYCRENQKEVSNLVEILIRNKVDVWWDKNLTIGKEWGKVIEKEIKSDDYFLLVLSQELLQKEESYVWEELKIAAQHLSTKNGSWLLPVLLSDCKVPDREIGSKILSDFHAIPVYGDFGKKGIDEVLRAILPKFTIRPEMVSIPPTIADNTKDTQHSFLIGKYLVTQEEWKRVMGNNPSHHTGNPNRPVESISWIAIQDFLKKLNQNLDGPKYRLPTEAEWVHACSAGEMRRYYFFDNPQRLEAHAWFAHNSGNTTKPVGMKQPNSWDLYDMLGNVCEWIGDSFKTRQARTANHSGYEAAFRGGSYDGGDFYCSSEFRGSETTMFRYANLGFRLAQDLDS